MLEEFAYSPSSTYAQEDFQGAAKLFLTQGTYAQLQKLSPDVIRPEFVERYIRPDCVDLDLLIQGVDFTYKERSQIEPMMGDFVSLNFFGKSPMVLSIRAKLIDTPEQEGKRVLTTLYSKLFRISMVAKHKITPYLDFVGYFVQGAFLSMDIMETSQNDTVLDVTAQFLVFNMQLKNPDNVWNRTTSVDILYNKAGWVAPNAN